METENLKQLHQQQDDFIKQTLQQDKLTSQSVSTSFEEHLDKAHVKVKRYSYKQKRIIIILLLLLLVSAGYNVYFLFYKNSPSVSENKTSEQVILNPENKTNTLENEILNETDTDKELENTVKNTVDNVIENVANTVQKENTYKANTVVANVTETAKPKRTFSEIDTNELSKFIENYSLGIQRISYDQETLESNTILIYLALDYFSSKNVSTAGLKIDTTYASSKENVNLFIKELMGKDFSNADYISSFKNYVAYHQASQSYVYGKDISNLEKEKYSCKKLEITNEKNGMYTASATISRIIDEEETLYDVTFTFRINSNYKYNKYNIISLKSKNTSFYPDNTPHLVGDSVE